MANEFQFEIFLSHSAKDKAVVRPLAERLRKDGLKVWFDEWVLKPGDSIPAKIEAGLEHSRVLVLCMSANAFGSDWAQLEAGTFRFRDPLNKERRFIPLRLDDAPIKGSLAQFLYINWRPADREQEYARLVELCRQPLKPVTGEAEVVVEASAVEVVQLSSYRSRINAYAFSADGKRAVSGSDDRTVRLWDLETGLCKAVLNGHKDEVWSVAYRHDHKFVLSGSKDKTVRLWDLMTGHCLRIFEGHRRYIESVRWSSNGQLAASGSGDRSIRLWDVETGQCVRVLEGHKSNVWSVAWCQDQCLLLSGSHDNTIRLWDADIGYCLHVFEGHTDGVTGVVFNADASKALSASKDNSVRVWDLVAGRCLHVMEGHTAGVYSIACSPKSPLAVSGSDDGTVRVWDFRVGSCLRVLKGHNAEVKTVAWSADGRRAFSGDHRGGIRLWNLSELAPEAQAPKVIVPGLALVPQQVQYSNAKVLLVGDTSSGKTGLTERLAHDRPPQRGSSTSGTWSTQWPLKDLPQKAGWDREVWLWDFGGQADQRLIHQLYLDRTALVLLMFDSDREIVLPSLREWQQALARSEAHGAPTFLVAGRTDVGFRFDREKVRAFAKESGYGYFETSAETGIGIPELREAMLETISWDELTPHNSPALFKRLKDEILKLRDEGAVIATFKELESVLRSRLPTEIRFAEAQLDTVVSLLDGPGLVKELNFGGYILLRPEWMNTYAQAVIRTLRASESGLGYLPVSSIMEGKLIFQTKHADGKAVAEKRLRQGDEKVVLQAMEQMLIERRLCLRQDGDLVFPSYCGLERPVGPVPPKFFASYAIRGFLDDIYATLVVKLAHCGAFTLRELWRDAADFATLADSKIVGIKLVRSEDGRGELLAHHSKGVTGQEQVIFASYIHEHLSEKSTEEVPRLRYYTCPNCDEPVENRKLAMERLEQQGEKAVILCQRCEEFIPLWDTLEKRFASKTLKEKVAALRRQEHASLDSRRLGQLLVHEVSARLKSANQNCHEIPGDEDVAIDMEVEFTDDEGYGTGKHMYLQLKAGNSYLKKRKRDGAEIFAIKKQRWVKQWIRQDGPMMLVIGTFPEEPERAFGSEKKSFAEVRWMEIGELLKVESANGTQSVRQIVFKGDRLDAASVGWWRGEVLTQIRAEVPVESRQRLMKWAGGGAQVTLAVVFTDIVGRKGLGKRAADADWSRVRDQHFARGKALIEKLDGLLVKTMGDGLIAVFRNAPYALDFMLELRRKSGDSVVSVRQVAHLGVVTPGQDAVFGQHVNLTARLSAEALEGDIVVSDVFKKGIDAASSPQHRAMQWERIIGVSFRGFPGKFDLWRLGMTT